MESKPPERDLIIALNKEDKILKNLAKSIIKKVDDSTCIRIEFCLIMELIKLVPLISRRGMGFCGI